MSEYQYYEFLALDKPLTATQRAELRELSTRAEITATRFVNEYNYGDFRGEPQLLMERYFDAFLYLANWGTRHLMFRLPSDVLDAETAKLYCHTDAASVSESGGHLIISLYADREPDDDWIEGRGQLGSMIQARPELAAGDLRLLYLAWLLSIQFYDENDENIEPPVPAGLGNLSAPLQAIAEFLDIDEDLLAVAAEMSPDAMAEEDDGRLFEWIASLSPVEKDALLTMVANGEGAQVQGQLLRRFRGNADRVGRAMGPGTASASRRTIAELWAAAEDHREAREKAEELRQREAQAREAAAEAAAYTKRLDELAPRAEAAWTEVAELIETRSPREYDQAVARLCDLRALAERQGDAGRFAERFLKLRALHARKPSLQARFGRASLPGHDTRP